jgi:hypothetical protein
MSDMSCVSVCVLVGVEVKTLHLNTEQYDI